MVRPAVRQAHGHEDRRMAHHPEQSRRTILKFEFSNYLNKFWILGIWYSDLFRISTCPPPVCWCHAIASAPQGPVRIPYRHGIAQARQAGIRISDLQCRFSGSRPILQIAQVIPGTQ